MSARQRPSNASSMLLQQNENDILFQVLGRGCVTLASGVVQLYLADQPDRTRWNKRCCGVACFVKDNPKRSYFIRVFDVKKGQQIWEQELYNQFKYKTPREYFHIFEAQSCMAGLNFASEDEAFKFKNAVEGKLHERATRRRDKKRQTVQGQPPARPANTRPPVAPMQNNMMQPPPATSNVDISNKNGTLGNKKPAKGKDKDKDKDKDKNKKLTKADIGAPTEFRHVSHVGWDPNKGFDMNNLDPDMKQLFQLVGIDQEEQIDKDTVDFIYDFVEKSGGMDVLRKEMKQRPPPPAIPSGGGSRGLPPPPNRSPAAPPPPSRAGAPPPPPSRTPARGGAPPPPPPHRATPPTPKAPSAAPPPPPMSGPRSVPPPPPPTGRSMPPPPPPVGGAPPPPPPPPPPPSGGPPPPPPPPPPPSGDMDNGGGGGGGGRGALLQAIQAGKKLRTVDSSEPTPARPQDSRGQLLDAIRQGASLKPVDMTADRQSTNSEPEEQDGLVGALARALLSRNQQIHGEDDEESEDEEEDEDDDDEWDD